jgi:DNA polymerase III epsilon subunit family exonuclease
VCGLPGRDALTAYTAVDIETTGLSPDEDLITELAAVRVRGGRIVAFWSALVRPGRPIPPEIVEMTGITDDMVSLAGEVEEAVSSFVRFVAHDPVIAHNVQFDLAFLDAALERLGRPPVGNMAVDTAELSRDLLDDAVPDHRLGTLARHFGIAADAPHRALGDALLAAAAYERLAALSGDERLDALSADALLPARSTA